MATCEKLQPAAYSRLHKISLVEILRFNSSFEEGHLGWSVLPMFNADPDSQAAQPLRYLPLILKHSCPSWLTEPLYI